MNIHPSYHSGLAPELDAEPLDRFACGPVLALKHDIRDGWPKEFSLCDVIYSEPPWRVGYNEFLRRAGASGGYERFVEAFASALSTTTLPTFVTLGGSVVGSLPEPVTMRKIKLHGLPAWLAQYEVVCPHCGQQNVFKVEELEGSRQKASQ